LRLISHRGNTDGPRSDENDPRRLAHVLSQTAYDVELDLRMVGDRLFLGHDRPDYAIDADFLSKHKERLWIHAKNLEALNWLLGSEYIYFWHQEDDYTLTSNGKIWTYPGKRVCENSIIVIANKSNPPKNVYGVCSDYVDHLFLSNRI
jgi:hypothetical protein